MRELILSTFCCSSVYRLVILSVELALAPLLTDAQPSCADTLWIPGLQHKADSFERAGNLSAALEIARQVYGIFSVCHGPDHLSTIRAKMRLGIHLDNLYQKDSAIALFSQCLPLLEAGGNPDLIGWCHYQLGLSYRGMGQFADAHRHLQTALALVRPDSAAKSIRLAGYKIGEAMVFIAEKNYRPAVALCGSALDVYEKNDQTFNKALAAYNLAEAYFGLQDYQRALEWYLTAYGLLKSQQRLAAYFLTDLLVSIGFFYQKTGEAERGLEYMLQAQASCLQSCGPDSMQYARFLHEFGSFYLEDARYATAAGLLEKSLALKQKARPDLRERVFQIKTYELLGDAYAGMGQPDRAQAAYCALLDIANQHLNAYFRDQYKLRYYTKLAEIQWSQGDWSGSLSLCDSALACCRFPEKQPEQIFPRDYFREVCRVKAQALMAQYDQTADLAALEQADYFLSLAAQTLFREAAELSTKSSKAIKFDRDHRILQQWLDARMKRYAATGSYEHAWQAFLIAGQSKALLLYEARCRKWSAYYAGTPDSLLRVEWDQQGNRITSLENELDSLRSAGVALTDSASLSVQETLVRQRHCADSLLERLRQTCPEYFKLRYPVDTTPVAAWKHWLPPDQCILLYSLSDRAAYVFVLSRDTLLGKNLPLDFSLADSIQKYRECLVRYFIAAAPDDALYAQSLEQYHNLATFLFRRLVAPLAGFLSRRVIIIPEGPLCYLPFETLLTGLPSSPANFKTYPFLLRDKAISYSFSTDLLREMSVAPSVKAEREWLGIAPFFQSQSALGIARHSKGHSPFQPLPYSGREVEAIRGLWGGDLWLGDRAKQSLFRQQAGLYRILHLATHGKADENQGDRSYIAFSGEGAQALMPAGKLYEYTLPAEMAVLSACEAGGGRLQRGEGIIGLVRAFAWTGVKSIVASMWVADDERTARLMLEFYRRLRLGIPKDVALQQAQLQLCRDMPSRAHPFYWAGFRLYGRVAPLDE